jgi:serine-type D-Ala-D-Ala carboxypeptidase (penicillin-binding protein 5/6)
MRACPREFSIVLAGCATAPTPEPPVARAEVVPFPAAPPLGQPAVWPADAPIVRARHAILIDARTGRTLYQKFADAAVPVASTQKLLTALVVLERGGLDGTLVVHPVDTLVEPAKLYLRAGQVYSRRTLLTAMMVKSENDAAAALARDHSGSMSAFAVAMNRKAWALGARSSNFANSHGLPARQHSTARDMARIAYRAYREPVLRGMMALPSMTFVYANGRTKTLQSTNKLLGRSPTYNGMKTGFTYAAGRCLISSASSSGRDVILVQLGSKSAYIFDDAERLMQWGLARTGGAW